MGKIVDFLVWIGLLSTDEGVFYIGGSDVLPPPLKGEEERSALEALENEDKYGVILRAKGILPLTDGKWIHFDYVPGEPDVRSGSAAPTGRLCVIGSNIKEDALKELFQL